MYAFICFQGTSTQSGEKQKSCEEVDKTPTVDKEDHTVHSQVDRDASSFSMETFGQFRIPKKAPSTSTTPSVTAASTSATTGTATATTSTFGQFRIPKKSSSTPSAATAGTLKPKSKDDGSSQSTDVKQHDHKTGVSPQSSGDIRFPAWDPKKSRLENLISGDWLENIQQISKLMPQIPDIHSYLDRNDMNELREEYLAAVKEGKLIIKVGGKEFQRSRKELKRRKVVGKLQTQECKTQSDYFENQVGCVTRNPYKSISIIQFDISLLDIIKILAWKSLKRPCVLCYYIGLLSMEP